MNQVEEDEMGIGKILDQPPQGWLTSDEMGQRLGITRQGAVSKARSGELEAVKVNNKTIGRKSTKGYVLYFRPVDNLTYTRNRRTVNVVYTPPEPPVEPPAPPAPPAEPVEQAPTAPPQPQPQPTTTTLVEPSGVLDGMVTAIMTARGLTWGDLALHLGLVQDQRQLVEGFVAQRGASALAKALLEAQPNTVAVDRGEELQALRSLLKEAEEERERLSNKLREAQEQRPILALHPDVRKQLNDQINDLSAQVRERDAELAKQDERLKGLQLQLDALRKRGMLVEEFQKQTVALQQEIANLTMSRDGHAKSASEAIRKLAEAQEQIKKMGVAIEAQRQETEKYKAASDFYEDQCFKLRAKLDGQQMNGSSRNGAAAEPSGPVAVTGAVYGALRAIMDPDKHPSGNSFRVGPPYDRKEVLKQMRRTGETSYKPAIRWIEDNPDLWDVALQYGFQQPSGTVFVPGE